MVEYELVLTGLGLIVAITYYSLQIRNQNKTRQAQLFMQIFNHYVSSDFREALNEIEKWEWTTFEEYWEKYGDPNRHPDNYTIFSKVGMFYEGLGTLLREELINAGMISQFFGGVFIEWFEKWFPVFEGVILMADTSGRGVRIWNLGYLYEALKKYRDENPKLFETNTGRNMIERMQQNITQK